VPGSTPPLIESLVPRSPRPKQADQAKLAVPSVPPASPRPAASARGFGSVRPSVSGRYSMAPAAGEDSARPAPPISDAPRAERGSDQEQRLPDVRLPEPRPAFDSRPEIQAALDLSATFDATELLQIYGRVQNATDEAYQEVVGYNTAGRSIYGGVRMRF